MGSQRYMVEFTHGVDAENPTDALMAALKAFANDDVWVEVKDMDRQFVVDAELADVKRTLPLGAPRCWPVVSRDRSGKIMMVFAVCSTEEKAQECADTANQWYGEGHPMTPLTVDTTRPMLDPRPFPVQNKED